MQKKKKWNEKDPIKAEFHTLSLCKAWTDVPGLFNSFIHII